MDLKEKTLSREIAYEGSFLKIEKDTVLVPNGNKSKREIVRHPGACAVVAFKDGKIMLERQYRYALDETILEIPAGKKDKGETDIECAARELEEESGYKANDLKFLGTVYSSVGICDEKVSIFEAHNLEESHTNFDSDEIIELEYYTVDEVLKMIKDGVIKDGKTVAAMGLYLINQK